MRPVYPRFAHAPQRRCDCVANDESWRIIGKLRPLIRNEVKVNVRHD